MEFLKALAPEWVQEDRAWRAVQGVLSDLVKSERGLEARRVWMRLVALIERVQGRRGPLTENEFLQYSIFASIAYQMGQHFLFMVEISDERVETRTILKYSLDQEAPLTTRDPSKRVLFKVKVPDIGFAESQHIAVEVPDGVVLEKMTLEGTIFEGDVQDVWASDEPKRRLQGTAGHITIRPSSRFLKGELLVWVVPAKQGLYRFAKVSIVMVTIVVGATWWVRHDSAFLLGNVLIPSPAASILLLGPALLLSWFSRTTEHTLLAKVQGPLRLALLGTALALLVLAVLAAIPVSASVWNLGWVLATCIQGVAFLLLVYFVGDLGRRTIRSAKFFIKCLRTLSSWTRTIFSSGGELDGAHHEGE
ncbi:hypothetical protein [Arthrobacter sp. TB 23]|uniref:hypothetical protein n=1 Tax=Arthrobacter sp. TB 23 TaxID=494419 RepID=UPI001ED963DA|nr:hypothetical protein [Arthrobacter sp. TB 23]